MSLARKGFDKSASPNGAFQASFGEVDFSKPRLPRRIFKALLARWIFPGSFWPGG